MFQRNEEFIKRFYSKEFTNKYLFVTENVLNGIADYAVGRWQNTSGYHVMKATVTSQSKSLMT